MITTGIVAILLATAAPETPERSEPTARKSATVGVLWIRTRELSYDALAEEIHLRLPEVELAPYGDARPAAPTGTLTVFVDVRPAPERARVLELTLVASDGRAYDRVIELDPDATPDATRELVARNVANLVFGLESGTVAPDRDDVSMPAPTKTEPPPDCPPLPAPAAPPPAPPSRSPRVELGPGLSLGVVTGLGPPAAFDRFAAWGGELDLGVRWRSGAAFVFGLRTSGRSHSEGARIVRVRLAFGGGYVFRPRTGAFELAAHLGAAVEPWVVLDDGSRVDFTLAPLPTLGAWARVAPGWLMRSADRSFAAQIGAFAELAVSYAPASDPIVAVYTERAGQRFPMFRVGGPELSLGLHTRLWFPVW